MTSTLVYRRPCEHGEMQAHAVFNDGVCRGSIDIVLDPDKVLVGWRTEIGDTAAFGQSVTVSQLLDVLDRDTTTSTHPTADTATPAPDTAPQSTSQPPKDPSTPK